MILLLTIVSLIAVGCVTSKSLAKKAVLLEQAGEYTAASELFYQSIQRNPRNTDAIIGIKRTGNKVLTDKLKKFSQLSIQENYEDATYAYLDANKYVDYIKNVNVILEIPENYQEKYTEVLNQFLTNKYEKGLKMIGIENFTEAEKCFNEIYKFDKNFKDVAELRNIAYLEPYYRKADKLKKDKEYRKAYNAYSRILSRVGNYKDTKKSMEYVLAKGRMYITLSSVPKKRYSQYSNGIKQNVINTIINANDPFIRVVERDDLDKVIKEQELALGGLSNSDVEVGEIAGAQYNVVIDVTTYSVSSNPLKKEHIKGLESYREKYKDSEGKSHYRTKYKDVYYYEYRASRSLMMAVSYKIISMSTSEIIATNIIKKNFESNVHYVTYSGNSKQLYPSRDKNGNRRSNSNLQRLLKAPRNLKSVGVMIENFNDYSAQIIANNVISKLK